LVILTFRAVKILIGFGTSPSNIHLIGFSLGAHFAAYVAKAIPGIGRITGKYI
jgi:acetyl esterase/lipase